MKMIEEKFDILIGPRNKELFQHENYRGLNLFRKFLAICAVTLLSVFSISEKASAQITASQGSYLIDMSANSSAIPAGLRPYGMIHELVKFYKIPVVWVVRGNKAKDEVDYTVEGYAYKGGVFIIPKAYITSAAQAVINQWIGTASVTTANGYTAGLVTARVLNAAYMFNGANADTINVAPSWTIDAANGKLVVPFYTNAGIPATAYNSKTPASLGACDDIFVLPHADPTWATHGNLYGWNSTYKGAVWVGCHAVSVLSNTYNPANVTQQMNFLTSKVTTAGTGIVLPVSGSTNPAQNSLILYRNHSNGTAPFNTNLSPVPSPQTGIVAPPDDYVSQFIGGPAAAQQNGSEQIYMPVNGASWLPSTNIITYDPMQTDVSSGKSPGAAATIAYGRAFGDNNRGLVMYEAGHNINQSNGGVAAERAFFNWSFLAAKDKAVHVGAITGIPANGKIYVATNLSVTATSPVNASPFTYTWSVVKVNNASAAGTFSPNAGSNASTTTFTPGSVTTPTPVVIYVSVTDACGRTTTTARTATLMPLPAAPQPVNDAVSINSQCYVPGMNTTVNVAANDTDPDGDLNTSSVLLQNPANASQYGTSYTVAGQGVWTSNGANVTFAPAAGFFGTAMITYQICDNTPNTGTAPFLGPLCATATLTVGVGNPDVHGCYPGSVFAIVSTTNPATITSSTNVTNPADATGASDYDPATPATYAVFTGTNSSMVLDFGAALTVPSYDSLDIDFASAANGSSVTITVETSTDNITWSSPVSYSTSSNGGSDARLAVPSGGVRYIRIKRTSAGQNVWVDAVTAENWDCTPAVLTANDDNAVTPEDMPVTIDVTGNDNTPGLLPLTISIVTPAANGIVGINTDNTVTYLNNVDYPAGTADAVDSFKYKICNTEGFCAVSTVRVLIKNDGCTAGNYRPVDGTPVTRTFSGTLATVDANMQQGNPTQNQGNAAQSNVGKRPNKTQRLLFEIVNDSLRNAIPANAIIQSATLKLVQTGGDHLPMKVSAYQVTGNPMWLGGNGTNNSGVTWNSRQSGTSWTTAGGDFNPVPLSSAYGSASGNATFVFNILPAVQQWQNDTSLNRGILVSQNLDTTTLDKQFTIGMSENGQATNRPVFTITYVVPSPCTAIPNRAPLANPDTAVTTTATAVNVNVLTNDRDADAGTTLSVASVNMFSPSKGTVSVNNNIVTYTPNSSVSVLRTDTLWYKLSDGALFDTAYVYVKVNPADPNVNTDSSAAYSGVSQVVNLAANDNDPNNLPLSDASITQAPQKGTYSLSGNTLTYTPAAGFYGYDSLIYQRCEVTSGCTAGLCDTARVIFTVNNRPPVANDTTYATRQCTPLTFTIVSYNDPESEQVTVSIVSYDTVNCTLTSNGSNNYTVTPASGYTGTLLIRYRVTDPGGLSSATKTITINVQTPAVNQAPVAQDDNYNTVTGDGVTQANSNLYIDVLANDTDPEGNQLVASLNGLPAPAHGTVEVMKNGTVVYHPDFNYVGTDVFQYRVCDTFSSSTPGCPQPVSSCDTATVTVLVQPVTSGPVQLSGTVWNDVNGSANGTFSNIYTTAESGTAAGNTPLYVYLTDNSGNVIDKTVVLSDGTYLLTNVPANATGMTLLLTTADVPVGSGQPSVQLPAGWANTSPLINTSVSTNGRYLSGMDYGMEQLPVPLGNTAATQTNFGANTTVNAGATLFGGTDPDGGIITAIKITSFPSGATSIWIDGVEYTTVAAIQAAYPTGIATNAAGNPKVAIKVNPDDGASEVVIPFTVIDNAGKESATGAQVVLPLARPPIAVDDTYDMFVNTALSSNLGANDTCGSSRCTYNNTPVRNPVNGTVTIRTDGTFTYVPDPGFIGNDTFRYSVCNMEGVCDTAMVVITIHNDSPLSVALISFTAGNDGNCNVELNWETGAEDNFNHFEIEVSTDGVQYESVASMAAKGNGSKYRYDYRNAHQGKNFFRLKMVDADGKSEHSRVLSVWLDCKGDREIKVYPTKTSSTVTVDGVRQGEYIAIYDVNGRVITERKTSKEIEQIDLGFTASGIYNLVIITADNKKVNFKVIKE